MIEKNYTPWDSHPTIHGSLLEFRDSLRAEISPGVHVVTIDDRTVIDVLISGNPGSDGRAVPVFLNGAVPKREDKTGPFFSGVRVGQQAAVGFVSISDPSVDRDRTLSLAWYAGNRESTTPQGIIDVIETLADALSSELVLTGGSGGGFASLYFASKCKGKISAFVWNPQTDILAYNRNFVDIYLKSAYPGMINEQSLEATWLEDRRFECAKAGIEHSVTEPEIHEPTQVHRLLMLQNQPDWHLSAHAVPYITRHSFKALGTGSYVLDNDHVVQVATWGDGHAPLPFELVVRYLREFLDGKAPALSIGRALATNDECSSEALFKAPQDLRPLASRLDADVTASRYSAANQISISFKSLAIPPGYGGLRFGLVHLKDNLRQQLAWHSEKHSISFDPDAVAEDGTLLVNLRDGMNNSLVDVAVGPREDEDCLPVGEARAVFIYGSCVTRDAFELETSPPLAEYVARSAIISAMGDSPETLPEGFSPANLSSAFQRRMVEWDVNKSLPVRLSEVPHSMVVIDLIDERLGVVESNGGLITRSSEAMAAGLRVSSENLFDIDHPEFMQLWAAAANKLAHYLAGQRVVINRALWARVDQSGVDLNKQFAVTKNNAALNKMYDLLESILECDVINYPEHLLVADSNHRWGLSPFHYTRNFYEYLIEKIKDLDVEN